MQKGKILQYRGAYVCKTEKCINGIEKKGVLEKAFRLKSLQNREEIVKDLKSMFDFTYQTTY